MLLLNCPLGANMKHYPYMINKVMSTVQVVNLSVA